MADMKMSGSSNGQSKQQPPQFPNPDQIDMAVSAAILETYDFFLSAKSVDIEAMSAAAAAQLTELRTDLLAQSEPTHSLMAENVPPDTPNSLQRTKDWKDAAADLDSAIANATRRWIKAEIAWNRAVAAYEFELKSAEGTLQCAVAEAREVYQEGTAETAAAAVGATARYMTFKLAAAKAIKDFVAAVAHAAKARGATDSTLRTAFVKLTSAVYAAQGAAEAAMAAADLAFWQRCQPPDS